MHVLVTGGAGFIGSAVVDELVRRGDDVRVLDLLHPAAHRSEPSYLNDRAEYRWCDVRDLDAVLDALAGVDAVAHQAAMVGLGLDLDDVVDYVEHNDRGTAVLLQALHRRRFRGRLVLASSMVVYGEGLYRCDQHGEVRPAARSAARLAAGEFEPTCAECDREVTALEVPESAPTEPRSVYAATKLHQEHLCAAYGRESGATVVSLRYHNVYGPRMPTDTPYAGVASIFRSALRRGEPARVFEDGGQRRDFVHVADVARANLLALHADLRAGDHRAVNIASGEPRCVLEMAERLAHHVAGAPPPVVTGDHRAGDVRHVTASPELAREWLGFRAGVSFADGMREFAHAALRDEATCSSW